MSKQPEAVIADRITDYLKTLDETWYFVVHGGMFQVKGVPDILGVKNGRFFALEVKTPTGTASKIQEYVIGLIRKAGGVAEVVRSVEDVKEVFEREGL